MVTCCPPIKVHLRAPVVGLTLDALVQVYPLAAMDACVIETTFRQLLWAVELVPVAAPGQVWEHW